MEKSHNKMILIMILLVIIKIKIMIIMTMTMISLAIIKDISPLCGKNKLKINKTMKTEEEKDDEGDGD